MDINQVIQNLAAKDQSSSPDSKANELNTKLKEALKNDPESFENLVAELEANAKETLSEDIIPDLGEAETTNPKMLNQERTSPDLKSSLSKTNIDHDKTLIDSVQTKNSGLRILEADTNNANGVTILKDKNALDDLAKVQNSKSELMNIKLEHAARGGQESNLSLDEIDSIQKVLESKKGEEVIAPKADAEVLNKSILKNNKQTLLNMDMPKEQIKTNPLIENSEDFVSLNNNDKIKELKSQNSKLNFSKLSKQSGYHNSENNIINLKETKLNTPANGEGITNIRNAVNHEATIANMSSNQMKENAIKGLEVGGAKTFQVENLDTTNREAIINKVSDYIVQSKINNSPKLEMNFSHQDIGQVELLVEKGIGDQVNVMISPKSAEGMRFFTQHQSAILTNLANSGVSLGEFKLDGQATGQNGQGFDQSSSQQFAESHQGNQRDQDSRRRQELWQYYQNREAA